MYLRYMKKTSLTYLAVSMIFVIQFLIGLGSAISDYITQGQAITWNALSIRYPSLMLITLLALAGSQGAVLITSIYDLNRIFGLSNRKNITDIFKFIIVHSIAMSLVFNVFAVLSSGLSTNYPMVTFGLKWHVLDNFSLKLLMMFTIFYAVYVLIIWIIVGKKKHGLFHGIARFGALFIINSNLVTRIYEVASWGENLLPLLVVMTLINIIATIHVFYDMVSYEGR